MGRLRGKDPEPLQETTSRSTEAALLHRATQKPDCYGALHGSQLVHPVYTAYIEYVESLIYVVKSFFLMLAW